MSGEARFGCTDGNVIGGTSKARVDRRIDRKTGRMKTVGKILPHFSTGPALRAHFAVALARFKSFVSGR